MHAHIIITSVIPAIIARTVTSAAAPTALTAIVSVPATTLLLLITSVFLHDLTGNLILRLNFTFIMFGFDPAKRLVL